MWHEIKSGDIIPMTRYQEEIILPDIEFKPEMLSYKDRLDYINHLISDEGYEFLTLEDKKFYIWLSNNKY